MQGALVRPVARYPASIAQDDPLKVASNRVRTSLVRNVGTGDTMWTVSDAARIVPQMLLSIDSEIVSVSAVDYTTNILTVIRGFDGTQPCSHSAGSRLDANIVAWHHNVLAAEITAIENALGPNLSNIAGGSGSTTLASKYIWAQNPGGALTGGSVNTVTLTPVPPGVNGTDKNHYLYVSGGTGTAEPVLIVGGSAVAGAASGTILFTPANNHTGSWSIGTATAGGQEALQAICYTPVSPGIVYYGPGKFQVYAPISIHAGLVGISGAGIHATELKQNTANMDIVRVGDNVTNINGCTVADLSLTGASATASTSGYGINVRFAGLTRIDNVRIYGGNLLWRGINIADVKICEVFHSLVEMTVDRGIQIAGTTNTGGRGNVDVKIWQTIVARTGSDGIFIGDYSQAHYILDSEIYGMQNAYGLNISPTVAGSFNYFIRNNDISASEGDASLNAGGVRLAPGVAADLTGNAIGGAASTARPAVLIEAGAEARIVGHSFLGGQIAIRNYGMALITGAYFNGLGTSAQPAIKAESTATITNVTSSVFYQYTVPPIVLDSAAAGVSILANTFKTITGGVCWTGTPADMTAGSNIGVDTLIPTLASAAAITIDASPIITLSGTTTILTINGGWNGRRVRFIKPNAGDLTIGGGGNIPAARTLVSFSSVDLVCFANTWF